MPYTVSSGFQIHYQVEGAGSHLLLYAGFTCTLRDWLRITGNSYSWNG